MRCVRAHFRLALPWQMIKATAMNTFLIILLVIFVIGAAVSLVRGIIAFLKTTEADLNDQAEGPSVSGMKQNKMMINRVLFQGAAVVVAILILALARK
jgi:hypothetical protein